MVSWPEESFMLRSDVRGSTVNAKPNFSASMPFIDLYVELTTKQTNKEKYMWYWNKIRKPVYK